jgi:hypothetical protein
MRLRLQGLNPGSGSQLFELIDNINDSYNNNNDD